MKVLKFGSASIATADKLKLVASLVVEDKQKKVVVLSSMRGTAEALAEISDYLYKKNNEGASEIITRLEIDYLAMASNLYDKDAIKAQAVEFITSKFNYIRTFTKSLFTLFEERVVMAQGELLSSELFYLLLKERGFNPVLVSALDYMRTDKNLVPDVVHIKDKLSALLAKSNDADLYITQGYISRNAYGEIDDLRKGGSDYTASLVGVAVEASEIQIWADVDVMQNNDSQYIKGTRPVRQLNFDEAAELAYFSAKILHPTSISPAKLANIPVRLKCTENPEGEGTLISNEVELNTIKAVAARENITAIKIKSTKMLLAHGFLRRVFEVFDQYLTPIDMLTTSEVGISVTIDDVRHLDKIVDDLKKYGTVCVDKDMVIVSVVGDLAWTNAGLESKILEALNDIPIRMISYGGSNYNMSVLIKKEDKGKALQLINDKLFN